MTPAAPRPNSLLAMVCFVIAICSLAPMIGSAQPAATGLPAVSSDRIKAPIDENQVITLHGNVHALARAEFDRGQIAAETRMERMVLVLHPDRARQRDLDALTEAQQQLDSATYHHWLTPAEYGARFGASTSDLGKIRGWLEAHGFEVEPVPAGRQLVIFSGTSAQVADTFHTQLHHYEVNGQSHIANVEEPQIPRALAQVVSGVLSLHDFRRASTTRVARPLTGPVRPYYSQGSTHYIFPGDFATIYDLNGLYAAGKNGSGTSIAIVGRSNINLSDVSSFRSMAGLPANQPSVILAGSNPGLVAGDQDEATLDVEWSGAVAPAATVKYVVGSSTRTTDGVDLSAQYIVNNRTAPVMSTSFGSCELYMGTAELAFYNNLWQQAAAEGISSFVSSGDSGAAGCNGGSSTSGSQAGVNGLCSSPYSTCVGGTQFNEGAASGTYWGSTNGAGGKSALSYIPEKVWNESSTSGGSGLWASGGGVSRVYPQPAWQKGVSGAGSNGMRAVPDVSLTSASHDGYLVCLNGGWYVFAGTSASSPSFAGLMALVVQNQKGTGQGNANPALYAMLSGSANPFHPTPSGSNTVAGVSGFTASGAAYNLATGLGSVDGGLLVYGWASGGTTGPAKSFTLTPSTATVTLVRGSATSFNLSIAGSAGFADSVTLSATTPNGVVVNFSPATAKPGTTVAVTVAASVSAALGNATIAINGTSATLHATTPVTVTVQAPPTPTLSLTTAAGTLTLGRGKTVSVVVTAATSGPFSGTLAWAVSGLPAGVSATWSATGQKATGAGTFTSTLTLKASSTATLGSVAAAITVTGGGLTAKTTETLQVATAAATR